MIELFTGVLKASLLVAAVRDMFAAVILGFVILYILTGRK